MTVEELTQMVTVRLEIARIAARGRSSIPERYSKAKYCCHRPRCGHGTTSSPLILDSNLPQSGKGFESSSNPKRSLLLTLLPFSVCYLLHPKRKPSLVPSPDVFRLLC